MDKDQRRYIEYVKQDIKDQYNLDHDIVNWLIKESTFLKTMEQDPEYVMHYNTEDWKIKIIREALRICYYKENLK